MDKAGEQLHQAVARKRSVPEIGAAIIAVVAGWIAGTEVIAPIERQPDGRFAVELRGHENEVGIDGKMHQRPFFEAEQRQFGVAIVLVLPLGVFDVLPRHGVLQL